MSNGRNEKPERPATLVYHQSESISRFDETLVEIARSCASHPLYLATPYFSVSRLRRYTALVSSWKLITDVHAALKSSTGQDREIMLQFFEANKGRCRSLQGLHAKVFSGPAMMLIGSANLTENGFLRNTEMSVRIDEQQLIDECRKWFDLTWQSSTIPDVIELRSFSQQIVDEPKIGHTDISGNDAKNDILLSAKEQCLMDGKRVYRFDGRGFNASGCRDSGSGFIVFAGSEARSTTTDGFDRDTRGYCDDRRKLIENHTLELRKVKHFGKTWNGFREFEEDRLVFVEDCHFSSWSRAASIVGGNLRSGDKCWQ